MNSDIYVVLSLQFKILWGVWVTLDAADLLFLNHSLIEADSTTYVLLRYNNIMNEFDPDMYVCNGNIKRCTYIMYSI